MKNLELLQCSFNALCNRDYVWFDIYSQPICEHLDADGQKAFNAIRSLLKKDVSEKQVVFMLNEIIDPVLVIEIMDFEICSRIDFYINSLNNKNLKMDTRENGARKRIKNGISYRLEGIRRLSK